MVLCMICRPEKQDALPIVHMICVNEKADLIRILPLNKALKVFEADTYIPLSVTTMGLTLIMDLFLRGAVAQGLQRIFQLEWTQQPAATCILCIEDLPEHSLLLPDT